MARYVGPVCRLCRRQGEKLYLKGARCFSKKCAIENRNSPPGQHGLTGTAARRKVSDYALQLREKQKARRIYGVLERQFRRYFEYATRRSGVTGVVLMQYLETRLDNIAFRLGFATSRRQARQLVTHGHFFVNGKKVTIAAYQVQPGDSVSVTPTSQASPYFKNLATEIRGRNVPEWLSLDAANLSGRVISLPSREQIDTPLKEQLVVEYYSR